MNAIEVQHLDVGYGNKVLLQNLNFSVAAGEVFVILGGSGCGKSSLLKNLFGLYQPLAGDVLIEGMNITKAQGQERQDIMTRFGVMKHLAILEEANLLVALHKLNVKERASRVQKYLTDFEIA